MPPLPLDERIVVIQRPKTLPLVTGSLHTTPQHPARSDPPAPPLQTQPSVVQSHTSSSVFPRAEDKHSSTNQWRSRQERPVATEVGYNSHSYGSYGHSHSNESLTLVAGRHKHRHTLDIKVSLGSRGGNSLDRGLWSSEFHEGSVKGRKEKKVSLHLDLRQEDRQPGGSLGRTHNVVVQQIQSVLPTGGPNPNRSSGVVPGIHLAERRYPDFRKERDFILPSASVTSTGQSPKHWEVCSLGNKTSSKVGLVHQPPSPHHSLPHYNSSPLTARHTSTFHNPYPAAITTLPSHVPAQLHSHCSQTRLPRGREHHPQYLHSLPLSPSSSRGGGFPSPDHTCTINLLRPFSCGCWRLLGCSGKEGHSKGGQRLSKSPSSTLSRAQQTSGANDGGLLASGVMGLKNFGGCLSTGSTTNTSSSNSTVSDCRTGLLGPLRCTSCSGGGSPFDSPTTFRKNFIGGCLPCAPLLTSGPLRAIHSCVTGCNPKASQAGSSSCSYCSSDPIVVTYNPRRLKPPEVGRGGGLPASSRLPVDDDDDYSVRTIWPEELAQKMTRAKAQQDQRGLGIALGTGGHYQNDSNGTNPVILDCRNLLQFTQSQLADHAGRRRLQQGKAAVLDFIGSASGRASGRDSLQRLWTKGGDTGMGNTNGLDEDINRSHSFSSLSSSPTSPLSFSPPSSAHTTLSKPKTWERGSLPSARSLHLVLNSLNTEQDEENMKVHLSLPLSSSLPTSLSDEGMMTPDVENAAVSSILPFLFLGNERDAEDLDLLLRFNIGFVVNVTTHLPLYHLDTGLIRYKRLPATDNSKQNLRQYFEEVFEFIEEAHQSGRGVLIHCQAGVSRSATIVIAYLMKHTRMTMMDAYKYVRGRRPVVSPNLNFMGQLLEFERDLNSGVTPRILTPKLSGLETQV